MPALIALAGFSFTGAAGTTLATLLLPVGALGAMEYWRTGQIDVPAAGIISLGLLIGAYLGARVGRLLPVEVVQRAFGVLLLGVGIRFVLFR